MTLIPTFRFGSIELTDHPFAVVFGHDRGAPEQVVAEVQSALRDGSLTEVTGYANRTVTLQVLVEGADLVDLANSEALLVAEALKARNEFTFNPGDGYAVDSVYDTFAADLVPEYDDELEINGYRRFTLTFSAYPWPRSASKVITSAVATDSPTVVDDGSSTTGWTSDSGTVSVVSGAVVSTYDPSVGTDFGGTNLVLTEAIDTSPQNFIGVDWKSSLPAVQALWFNSDPFFQSAEVRREPGATAGFTRSWYQVPGAADALTSLKFVAVHPRSTGSATLSIDQIVKSETLPTIGARQATQVVDPGGSVPAEGDVLVQHETSGLGQVIVYSHPTGGGYSPPLSPWQVQPARTLDPVHVSPGYNTMTAGGLDTTYRIPFSALPKGDVQLWARILRDIGDPATQSFAWAADSWVNNVAVGQGLGGVLAVNLPVENVWYMVPVARITSPPAYTAGAASSLQIRFSHPSLIIDEAWLFAMDAGCLTVVDCGTGTPATGTVHNRLRVAAPSLDAPFGRIEVGTAADWSDAFVPKAADSLSTTAPAVHCDQTGHRFNPDGSNVFTVTSGATDAEVSFEHWPRWHSNAGTA